MSGYTRPGFIYAACVLVVAAMWLAGCEPQLPACVENCHFSGSATSGVSTQ